MAGIVVVLSLVDSSINLAKQMGTIDGWAIDVSTLRLFRLMRIFKLVRSWRSLGVIIRSMLSAIGNLGHLSLVLFLVISVFAMLGKVGHG